MLAFLALLAVPALGLTLPLNIRTNIGDCPLNGLAVPLPTDQTALTVPAGQRLMYVALGRGIQNYTCSAGAYVTAGALANLYDASCLFKTGQAIANVSTISKILPEIAYEIVNYPDTASLPTLMRHQFVQTPSGLSPEFLKSDSKAFVIASKTASLNAPTDPVNDVPWLQLTEASGSLAQTIFRMDTVRGNPPTSCTEEGQALSVQYSAMYYFLN
ncbi:hypothetical protein M231_07050 [Tremella mesenterica]|uniref:Malate dehydrogenase n=1 Tax=Tremella mesenterica TaxID=5217 RepID=A0A4Q1BCC1_TREME|nr:hypothetical protein M231_07050 [Tremella mesenterica]